MGRVLSVRPGPVIPAQDTNLAFRMTKLVAPAEAAAEECVVAVGGLFWQDETTKEFDVTDDLTEYVEEAGYPVSVGKPLNFWFHAAKLIGELCDKEVVWEAEWSGNGTGPTVWTDGPYCIVYPPMSDSSRDFLELDEGTLSIIATVAGVEYGPINLVIEEEPIEEDPYGY